MDRTKKSVENYLCGYNCCQSIVCAHCDLIGLDEKKAYKLFEGFGSGVGATQRICGALSAAVAIIGALNSDGSFTGSSKKATYEKVSVICKMFESKFGSVNCLDILKGEKTVPFKCSDKVKVASDILNSFIDK